VKIAEVCLLLIEAKISLDFWFTVPQEFTSAPDFLLSGCWMFEILEEFQRRALSIKMSRAVESGPIMEGNSTPEIIINSGLDTFCLRGSFQDQNKILIQNVEMKSFRNEGFEILGNVTLFQEEEKLRSLLSVVEELPVLDIDWREC
jgi:hypothetical protein